MRKLRLGQVDYINCQPVYYAIEECLIPVDAKIYKGVPAELNKKFLAGKLDITPISSIEYARNADNCFILPGLSISADGRVASILLFSKVPVTELEGKKVCLTSSSATSVALLKIILEHYYHVNVEFITQKPNLKEMLKECDAALLIGDDAMKADAGKKLYNGQPLFVTDLGEVWKEFTGEKMIYALWVIRKEFANKYPGQVAAITEQLQESRQLGLANIDKLVDKAAKKSKLTKKVLNEYFTIICHDFTKDYQRALLCFYDYAYKSGLVNERVKLNIWGESDG